MNIAFDLHGTADRFPEFFSRLSHTWLGRMGNVYVITSVHRSRQHVAEECAKHNIVYDDIILTGSIWDNPADRGRLIAEYNIAVMFDDLPEYSAHFPESCLTFHVRHRGNFDFETKEYRFPQGFCRDDKPFGHW